MDIVSALFMVDENKIGESGNLVPRSPNLSGKIESILPPSIQDDARVSQYKKFKGRKIRGLENWLQGVCRILYKITQK